MATYYIATTGNDTTGNGSSGNPWATISKAFTASTSGDTIICAAGTYTWSAQTFSSTRTITGAALSNGLPTTIFDGGGASVSSAARWACSGGTITISNVWFRNLTLAGDAFGIGGYSYQNATLIALTNVVFSSITFGGVNCGVLGGLNATTPFTLTNCLIYNISRAASYSSNAIFCLYGAGSAAVAVTINNLTYYASSSSYPIALFNHGSPNVITLKNSVMQSVSSVAFGSGSSPTYTYSYSCANGFTSPPSGSNNITSDPLFVDAAAGNFRLRPTSPCLNTGTAN